VNPLSIGMLAIAMSTDAFAAAVGKGAALDRPHFGEALRTGAIFGSIEATTPLIGWALGIGAASYVRAFDHWIAFVLLGGIGLWMIRAGLAPEVEDAQKATRHSFWMLAATGLGTSIDAMAVGVGLAFIDVDIVTIAVAIGLTTFVAVTLGVMLGRVIGSVVGKRAEVAGGVLLILIGSTILVEHLGGA
jgi:putative Mn2+ efflux pump MntP